MIISFAALANRLSCLRNNSLCFSDPTLCSRLISFDTHSCLILPLSERFVVKTDDHARQVVCGKASEGVVDQLL
jgi:hypothetical protein